MSSNEPFGPNPGQPGPGRPGQPPSGYTFGPLAPRGRPRGAGGPVGSGGPRRSIGPGGPDGQPRGDGPPPPGRPPKWSNKRVAIIAGAAALLVLGGGTGIVLASQDSGRTGPGTTATSGSTPGPSVSGDPIPAGGSASDAVTGYLRALADNDPATALGYAAEPLTSDGTLSEKVLAASNRRAKLTDIDVDDVPDTNATSVDATYKLGKRTVTANFPVIKVGTDWKLQKAVASVSLTGERESSVPLKINGVTVKMDTVSLFPGSYAVTSGVRTLSYGKHNTLQVLGTSDVPDASRLKVTLTTTGKKVSRAAARKSYRSCLGQKATAPKDCPFGVASGDYKIVASTITWRQRGSDPFKQARFLRVGKAIGVKITMNVLLKSDCLNKGRPSTCSSAVEGVRVGYVIATNPKKKVVWRTS